MRSATFSSLACAAVVAALSIGSSSALAPKTMMPSAPEAASMTRRSAGLALIGSTFAIAAPAIAKEERSPEEIAAIEAQKAKMRKKIEDSKKSYRKTNDLVKERKETTGTAAWPLKLRRWFHGGSTNKISKKSSMKAWGVQRKPWVFEIPDTFSEQQCQFHVVFLKVGVTRHC